MQNLGREEAYSLSKQATNFLELNSVYPSGASVVRRFTAVKKRTKVCAF